MGRAGDVRVFGNVRNRRDPAVGKDRVGRRQQRPLCSPRLPIAGSQRNWVEPRAAPRAEGEAVWFTNNLMTLKATAQSTGGTYGMVEAQVPAGSGPPLHVHQREDEAFWILEGTLSVRIGEQTVTAGPGSYTFLPRDIPHTFVVEGDSPARILSICSPGGLEQYFVAAGRPAERLELPPDGPVDVGRLARVGEEFGVEILGPPMASGSEGPNVSRRPGQTIQ